MEGTFVLEDSQIDDGFRILHANEGRLNYRDPFPYAIGKRENALVVRRYQREIDLPIRSIDGNKKCFHVCVHCRKVQCVKSTEWASFSMMQMLVYAAEDRDEHRRGFERFTY